MYTRSKRPIILYSWSKELIILYTWSKQRTILYTWSKLLIKIYTWSKRLMVLYTYWSKHLNYIVYLVTVQEVEFPSDKTASTQNCIIIMIPLLWKCNLFMSPRYQSVGWSVSVDLNLISLIMSVPLEQHVGHFYLNF